MSHSLFPHSLSLETYIDDDCLLVLATASHIPDQSAVVTFVSQGIHSLKLPSLKMIRIFGHETGSNFPAWIQEIDLEVPLTSQGVALEHSSGFRLKMAWLMISVPITLGALGSLYWLAQILLFKIPTSTPSFSRLPNPLPPQTSAQATGVESLETALKIARQASDFGQYAETETEWEQVESQWRQAIASLAKIPETAPEYPTAQTKIKEYQQNLAHVVKQPEYYRQGVNQATTAVAMGKTAQSQTEWKAVMAQWEKAIASLASVSEEDVHYLEAQTKLKQYRQNLLWIQDQLQQSGLQLQKTITGEISPKSIVASGKGYFFAQNMMYRHHIRVYDRNYQTVKTISDQVKLSDFGHSDYSGTYQGSPVEGAFSHNGQYAWISNYQMYGKQFQNPGRDNCGISPNYDPSFLYRIDTRTLEIDQAIKVGSVPKFVATTPDNRFVLVSNWCSGDLSVVNTQSNQEIERVTLGAYPRGIVVDPTSQIAYVAVMGSRDIAMVNLDDFSVNWITNIGASPRHLNLDPDGEHLYVSLNGENQVARIHLKTLDVVKTYTGKAPRSMTLSKNGKYLYVVNYYSHTLSKIRTFDMRVVQTVKTNQHPIGITYDSEKEEVWVACYSGSIMVFKDQE